MCAARRRTIYDLAYVLIYNRLGGPKQAARALNTVPLADRLKGMRTPWTDVADWFGAVDRVGAKAYTHQAHRADPTTDPEQLEQDAVAGVGDFVTTLVGI